MTNARWLTPNAPQPHKNFTRRLTIPASSDFLGLVNGALFELCQVHNWEQDGTMTPQEAADWFLAWWQEYLKNENEPPSWDSPENVDGQPEQPWYEQLEDWIIQGFLAVTFTPLAALVYQTTVPKIRVAIRTGNLGALFKVLINGVEVWTGDSYGPIVDIIDQVFDNPNPGTAATVHVIHNGNGGHYAGDVKLEVVRGDSVASMVATILRAEPEGCGIQWSTDNGGTWETIDLVTCISETAEQKIFQMIADGQLAVPAGQPGPQQPPSPGTCATYHAVLLPGAKFLLPSNVSEGDTITLSGLSGGWSLGELAWYCPDGYRFLLGVCAHDNYTTLESDPMQTARHMQIIGLVGETYFDPLAGPYEVPEGVASEPVYLMANTGLTGEPSGQAQFTVEVCTNIAAAWTYHFQFATGEHGFTDAASINGCASPYSNGAWRSCTNGAGYDNVAIRPPFWDTDAINLRGVRMKGHQASLRNDSGYALGFRDTAGNQTYLSSWNQIGDFDVQWTGDLESIKIGFLFLCTNAAAANYITDIWISGDGVCPYIGQ